MVILAAVGAPTSRRVQNKAAKRTCLGAAVAVAACAFASSAAWISVRPKGGLPLASRRTALLAPLSAAVSLAAAGEAEAEEVAMPSGALKAASPFTALLKGFYAVEAPLQAGSYDKAAVKERIEKEVASAPVVFYSYQLSPFCTQTREFLSSLGAKFKEVDLGQEWIPGLISADGSAVRAELGKMTGRTSMPSVFIGGKFVGGLFDGEPGLVPLQESGELTKMLKDAGAL